MQSKWASCCILVETLKFQSNNLNCKLCELCMWSVSIWFSLFDLRTASPSCNLEILSGRGRESQVLIVRVWVEESKYGRRANKNLTMCWKTEVVRQDRAILLFWYWTKTQRVVHVQPYGSPCTIRFVHDNISFSRELGRKWRHKHCRFKEVMVVQWLHGDRKRIE